VEAITCLVDGEQQDARAPAVSPLDAGILGHGVYESVRTYAGRPFALPDHIERLAAGAAALGFVCPSAELARDVPEAVRLRRAGDGESRIRIYLTAGGRRIVVADALPDRTRDRNVGLSVVSLPWRRDPAGPTAGVKASSTAAVRVAQRYAAGFGAATGIWLTPEGHVSEALAANVFCVLAGVLVTPPLSDGALAGVTRAHLMRYAADDGIMVEERSFTPDELAASEEGFLTATSEPVVPIRQLDGRRVGTPPGPVTRRLQDLFRSRALAEQG
jgi:branched-chain amino acid aminotransferase